MSAHLIQSFVYNPFFMASLCAVLFLNKCLWVFLFWQLQLFLALSCFIPHTAVTATLMPISRSQVQSDNTFSVHCCCTPKCLLFELHTSDVLVIRFTFIQIETAFPMRSICGWDDVERCSAWEQR